MKYFINLKKLLIWSFAALLIAGCHTRHNPVQNKTEIDIIPISDVEVDNTKYTHDSTFKEYYGKPVMAPPFNYSVDISNKSLVELRLLKNEIYARHGYLFKDAVLRGYFNQFDWYQPIFWDSAFKFSLAKEEVEFINKVNVRYDKLLQENYTIKDGKKFANMNNIMNLIQFKNVPDILMQHINKDGFAIAPADNEQLYEVYDQNQYDAVPNFVTTDTYLQLLYLHFRNILKELEEDKFAPSLDSLVHTLYNQSVTQAASTNIAVQNAAAFNAAYYAIAIYLLDKEELPVPNSVKVVFNEDMGKIKAFNHDVGAVMVESPERGSALLDDPLFDYTQLKPRGHYTSNDTLRGYFKCMKWLITTPQYINHSENLSAIVLTAMNLDKLHDTKGESLSGLYHSIDGTIGFMVGSPDNLSLPDVIGVLKRQGLLGKSPEAVLTENNLTKIGKELSAINPEQIHFHGVDDTTQKVEDQVAVYFMPSRYSFDGEILQRLIHILKPNPRRLFPKGLDVFATMGNKTAENILLNTYKESDKWPGYKDTLKVLQSKFSNFKAYDANMYNKMMQTFLSLQTVDDSSPYYMHSDAWSKRILNTSLAAWTELKHNVVLYDKEPDGAECGEGGGPPPPVYPGYVEPDVAFWRNCLSLLSLTTKNLDSNNLITSHYKQVNGELVEIANFFLKVSEEELKGENLTENEFDRIKDIGGEIENLSRELVYSDIPLSAVSDPDRCIGIVTDVYTYNDECLEEATGYGNEIYVVAQINGFLYLTRGAVFSYYEFTQPSSDRLTDEEWQAKMNKKGMPSIPVWMDDLMAPVRHLETKSNFTYSANPSSLLNP